MDVNQSEDDSDKSFDNWKTINISKIRGATNTTFSMVVDIGMAVSLISYKQLKHVGLTQSEDQEDQGGALDIYLEMERSR